MLMRLALAATLTLAGSLAAAGEDVATVDAAGLDPAVAATLDMACKPYTEEQLADCAYDLTALLSANSAGDAPRLSGLVLVKR